MTQVLSGSKQTLVSDHPQFQPTILVAEDDTDSRLMLKTLLEMKGYRIIEAADGREAIEAAERERPRLILMDLQLPHFNGFDVTRHMRRHAELHHTLIIICSGHDPLYHRPLALAAGCNAYLSKPIDFALLERTLNRLLPRV